MNKTIIPPFISKQINKMKTWFIILGLVLSSTMVNAQSDAKKSFYDFIVTTIDGKEFPLSQLKGKKVLVVNTASKCGHTPQYADLEKLYEK
jgi:glutathione peroxidase